MTLQFPHCGLVGNDVLHVHARPLDLAGGIEEEVVEMMIVAAVAVAVAVGEEVDVQLDPLVPIRSVLGVVVDDDDEVEVVLEHCWIAVAADDSRIAASDVVAALPEVEGRESWS